ncbi:MAG: Hsp20/alpha crystallin family protein [Deltaproteobacteria bacterium]|nr:Hsp20/alpha crystallin family protein [Deltaproteobacteria bacterium]
MSKQDKFLSFPLRLPQELDRLFDQLIHKPWGFSGELQGWNPSIDLYETPDEFVLEADLPGVKGEDVKVEVEGNEIILQGRRSSERKQTVGRVHYQERQAGAFMRRMALPESVDKDKIHADFKDGVLRVILPKTAKKGKQP